MIVTRKVDLSQLMNKLLVFLFCFLQDVFSTFSSDSGNVHDFPEGSEHRSHMTKSKSMPEYGDSNVSGIVKLYFMLYMNKIILTDYYELWLL